MTSDSSDPWLSPLLQAVEAGDERLVEILLRSGADAGSDTWHEDGDPPLRSAVHLGHWSIASRLLDAEAVEKADPRWLGEVLEAALQARGKQRAAVIAELSRRMLARFEQAPIPVEDRLLQKAAALLKRSEATRPLAETLSARVDQTRAIEEEVIDLFAEQERLDRAMEVLRAAPVAVKPRVAATFLPWIANDDQVPAVILEEILGLADRDIDRPDPLGRTALMYAAHRGDLPLMQTLVERGADIRHIEKTDGYSVLEYAAIGSGGERATAYLLERLQATASAFDTAADERRRLLPPSERSAEATHAAVEAASERRWDRVEKLLAESADINGHDRVFARRGRTLLAHAAWQGDRERVLWLVEHGADPEVKPGRESLETFARMHSDEMHRFLRQLRKKRCNAPDVVLDAEGIEPAVVDLILGDVSSFGSVALGIEGVPAGWPQGDRATFRLRCEDLVVDIDAPISMSGPGFASFWMCDVPQPKAAQLGELKRRLLGDRAK